MQEAPFSGQRSLPILADCGNVTRQGMEMTEADLPAAWSLELSSADGKPGHPRIKKTAVYAEKSLWGITGKEVRPLKVARPVLNNSTSVIVQLPPRPRTSRPGSLTSNLLVTHLRGCTFQIKHSFSYLKIKSCFFFFFLAALGFAPFIISVVFALSQGEGLVESSCQNFSLTSFPALFPGPGVFRTSAEFKKSSLTFPCLVHPD